MYISYDYRAKNLIECQKIARYINDPASSIRGFYHEIKADCVLSDVNAVFPKHLENSFNQPVERLSVERLKKIFKYVE
jgi:hypothetical protein